MADNTVLNSGSGGDTVRGVQRTSGGPKTQVVQIDMGGASANAEMLLDGGQNPSALSVPVVPASDWTDQSAAQLVVLERARMLHLMSQPSEGFVPLEIPSIGV